MIKIISFIHPHQLRIYSYSQITNYTRRGQHRPPLNLNIGDNIGLFKLKGKDYYRDFDIHHLQM